MGEFDKYQAGALSTAVYPDGASLAYLPLKLAGEAGEVAEKIGKAIRKGAIIIEGDRVIFSGNVDEDELCTELAKELGDVLWYVAVLADKIGYPLSTIANQNAAKLQSRSMRGLLIGEGDNR